MKAVVVDTDVISFIFKNDSRAERYRRHLTGHVLVLSFMTVAELDRWALQHDWGERRRKRMDEHLKDFVVYPYDRNLCYEWARVSDGLRRKNRTISCGDAWIAATATAHRIPLVTHNAKDFAGVPGLDLISEPNA